MPLAVRTIFGIYILLLLIPALYMWAGSMITGSGKKISLVTAVPALLGILTFQGMADVEIVLEEADQQSLLGRFTGSSAWIGLTVWMIFLTAVVIWTAVYQNRQRRNSITQESVHESLDLLSDGVCFYTDDGFPVLINITMNRLCGEIFGRGIMDGCKVWKDIQAKRGKDGIEFIGQSPSISVRLNDGSVWDFQRKRIMAGDREFWELTACDVTKEYVLNQELKARNEQLTRTNERLRQFGKNVKKVTRNEEILAAKMKVHDEIGRSLLQMRFWIEQGAQRKDARELLLIWKFISGQMKYGGIMDDTGNMDSVLEAAGKLHVTLIRQGEFPASRKNAEVIIEALKECMNNTVKHAGGRKLYFSSWKDQEEYHACFTNDGISPEGEIREKGGLKNLRFAVEEQGGFMKITSLPSFRLEIIFPEEEEEKEL